MKTVLTYGTFDVFHIGHLKMLERLKRLGDRLIVGVSTDEFNTLKTRPACCAMKIAQLWLRQFVVWIR